MMEQADPLPPPGRPSAGLRDGNGYVDLRSYAAIGDGRTVALIAQDGRIDWLPIPDMHSSPVFGALLDAENGGFIALRPDGPFTVTREYVPGTNVLVTTFHTASGAARVTDSLNTGVAGRLPWSEMARRIEGLEGHVRMVGTVRLGTCFNTASPWVQRTERGVVLQIDGVSLSVRTSSTDRVAHRSLEVVAEYSTGPGSKHLLALVATQRQPLFLATPEDIDTGIDRTIDNWRSWSAVFQWDGPFAEQVQRSALALKLLLFSPTGAMAAAATTSLPEWPGHDKNWDYRFAWVRDTAYSLQALFRFGLREEIHGAISWLLDTIVSDNRAAEPQVAYQLAGGRLPVEQVVDAPGWRGNGPVKIGNQAGAQLQLGVFGDLFSILGLYIDNGNVLDPLTARLMTGVAELACDKWRSPDSGMWELQEARHYVTSKLGCWKALTDAAALAESGQMPGDAPRWRTEAARIRAWVDEFGWSAELGAYVWYPGSADVDASILLHAVSGFDRGARMSSTLDVLRKQLGVGPHLYRYSEMVGQEGTFVACSFWMVSALQRVGRGREARALMSELIEAAVNDVGLLAEMIDPETGDFWGNLPQALSHLALINAAVTLDEADRPPVCGSAAPRSKS